MWVRRMHSTYCTLCGITTNAHAIGWGSNTMDLPEIVITRARKSNILMPGYVTKALTHFWHPPPVKIQDQLYPHAKPSYGAKTQHATAEDTTTKEIHSRVCGVFLFLARGVNGGLLPTLSARATPTGKPDGTNDGSM
jgi:hypothetical protein